MTVKVRHVLIPLFYLSLVVLLSYVVAKGRRPPEWGYMLWSTFLLMHLAFGSRPPESRLTLRELAAIPAMLGLTAVGMYGVAMVAKKVFRLPDATLLAIVIISGLIAVVLLCRAVWSLRVQGEREHSSSSTNSSPSPES